MDTMIEPKLNSFSWVELATNDALQAKDFYKGLFGWKYVSEKLPEDMGEYTSAMVNDLPAAAIFEMPKTMSEMNIPSHWGSYIRVKNVDETVAKAQSLGAVVLQKPMDVMEAGRMASLKDLAGAVFSVWEKKNVAGAAVQNNQQGAFSWNELLVHEPEKVIEFYKKLFSWQVSENKFGAKTYFSLSHADGYPVGGMMKIDLQMGQVPPHWGVYFTVDNVLAAKSRIEKNEGKVIAGPYPIEGIGEFLICVDPAGAHFNVIEFNNKNE